MALKNLSRRAFLRNASVVGSAALLSACDPKVVEKVVKQTVVVEKEVVKEVPKEVTVKETVIVAGTPKTVEKVVTATPSPKLAANIVLWTYPFTENDAEIVFAPLNALFNQEFPEVTVEVDVQPWNGRREKLYAAFAAGGGPDVHMASSDTVPAYYDKKLLLYLDDVLSTEALEGYADIYRTLFSWEGHLLAATSFQFCYGSAANGRLMEELGKDGDVFPATWDEMYELGELAKAKGWYADTCNTWSWGYWMAWVAQAGGTMFSADRKKCLLREQPAVDALTHMVKCFQSEYFPKEAAVASGEAANAIPNYFIEEKQVTNGLIDPNVCRYPEQVPGFVVVPGAARSKDKSIKADPGNAGAGGWAITANSKNVEPTAEWINFMIRPDIMGLYGTLSIVIPPKPEARKYWKADECVMTWVAKHAPTNFFIPQDASTLWQESKVVFAPHAQAAILGVETVEQALDATTTELQALLDQQA